jgi:hypothetical protein
MSKFGVSALFCAGLIAIGFSESARASTLTYDITLTQTSGTLITGSDFTVTSTFMVAAPTTDFESETISPFSIVINGKTYTSGASIQFIGTGANPGINTFSGFSASSGGDSLSMGGGGSFNLSGTGISSSDVGTVTIALATTPLPAAFPLFAGGLGVVGFLARRKKQKALAAA